MKNFSDLLAIDCDLVVQQNDQTYVWPLLEPLEFSVKDHVVIDGIEVLPWYQYLAQNGVLHINEPFYRWLHRASNQGWLLEP